MCTVDFDVLKYAAFLFLVKVLILKKAVYILFFQKIHFYLTCCEKIENLTIVAGAQF